jgi:hypothetical protein
MDGLDKAAVQLDAVEQARVRHAAVQRDVGQGICNCIDDDRIDSELILAFFLPAPLARCLRHAGPSPAARGNVCEAFRPA